MDNYFSTYAVTTNSADLFINIGWCPDKVVITDTHDGEGFEWFRLQRNAYGLTRATTGDKALVTSAGISLVKFTDTAIATSSDPSTVDASNYINANGIKLDYALSLLTNDTIVLVEAYRMNAPWIMCIHDGTTNSHTYFEDASFDFFELGVSGNGQWLIYNQTNGNYAYIKSVTKPMGKSKNCRIYTATDAAGTATSAADFVTSDVCFVFPVSAAQYPMSDIGLMTQQFGNKPIRGQAKTLAPQLINRVGDMADDKGE